MEHINIQIENGVTMIELIGRVDTLAANKIDSIIKDKTLTDSVIIDASKLEYISSLGLSIILKLAKKHKDIKVIHVSDDLYDIFEVTGFTTIIEIQK